MEDIAEIIVVEDDAAIRTILQMALKAEGYAHVHAVTRGDEALTLIRKRRPDLVLLDVMLPGLDGFTICARIREDPSLASVRVIMLTARAESGDVVRGLEAGADDYVTKPFDRRVLLARVKAVLRRGERQVAGESIDGLVFDPTSRTATLDGADLKLAPGEGRILALLLAHRGRAFARSRILDAVLTDEMKDVSERTIDVQVATLRRKLGRWAEHIETIRGIGYRVTV